MPDYAAVDLGAAEQIEFELNGRRVSAPPGTMLVDAAHAHGIEVPIFCYEPRLGSPLGACRMCLVEVEGMRGLQTACSTPVQPDMVVRTDSAQAVDGQDGVLELLLANHPLDCPVCDKGGECPLQDRDFRFGPGRSRFVETKRHFPKPLELSPLIALDRERCIACYRCTRFSQDVAEDGHLIMEERGAASEIATATGDSYRGRFTGNVIDLCPVGALTSIPYRFVARPWDIQNTPSVCAHCPVGCNTELTRREGRIGRVTSRAEPNEAVEEGWLCDKGRFAYDADRSGDRLTRPVIREGGHERSVTLEEAVEAAALLLGRDGSHALVLGGASSVEEGFLAQELAAGPLGGATLARLGLPERAPVAALRRRPAAQLGDLDGADVIAVVGGDPALQQPIVELRLRKARRRGAALHMLGPRRHLLSGLGATTITSPGALAEGVRTLAEAIRAARRPIVLWDEADLAIEPGAAEALAELLATRPEARQLALGVEVDGAGLRALGVATVDELPAEALTGPGSTLLCVHADPERADGGAHIARQLGRAEDLVVVATHRSAAAERATVVIPAATHYEQEGVLVSMAGRAQRLRPGADPPAGAAPAWQVLLALAHRLGAPPAYRTAAGVFAAAAAARAAFTGLDYNALGALGAPLTSAGATGTGPVPDIEGEGLPLVLTRPVLGDRTAHRSPALESIRATAELVLAPSEAERLGLAGGTSARLRSPYGECVLGLRVDADCPEGAAFAIAGVPDAGVGALLAPAQGPVRVQITRGAA